MAKTAAAPAPAPEKKPVQRGIHGENTGLTVGQMWMKLLRTNSKNKLTDDQIAAAMCEEFPKRKKYDAAYVKYVRGLYNAGKVTTQEEVPENPSKEYDSEGNVVTPKAKVPPAAKAKVAKAKPASADDEDKDEDEEDSDEDDEDDDKDEEDSAPPPPPSKKKVKK
jgi:hypothetical protein